MTYKGEGGHGIKVSALKNVIFTGMRMRVNYERLRSISNHLMSLFSSQNLQKKKKK